MSKEAPNTVITKEVLLPLREFGDIPEGLVSVYHTTVLASLPQISREGLRVDKNQMATITETNAQTEQALKKFALKNGLPYDRTKCVFASMLIIKNSLFGQ